MGQIANQMLVDLISGIGKRIKEKKSEKQEKKQVLQRMLRQQTIMQIFLKDLKRSFMTLSLQEQSPFRWHRRSV